METTTYPTRAWHLPMLLTIGLLSLSTIVFSQQPTITVRLANPEYDCLADQYCLDVEFQSNVENIELFGMNVRFFYDDANLEFLTFADFQGGYGSVAPDPPAIQMSAPGFGTTFFGFPAPGVADWVNGAIQLIDESQPDLFISTTDWTKLFQICFRVEGPILDSSFFCPPIVWDLEADPANGGYLTGDDGVVLTIVEPPPSMSSPSIENVVQFNWMYTGDGTAPPYGAPVPTQCESLRCLVDLALTKTLNAGQENVAPGDDVVFTIEVTNEGPIPVGEIHLIDYIPVGFTLNDADWTAGMQGSTGQSASIILSVANGSLPIGGLLSGQSVTVEITLSINPDIPSGVYRNVAEITTVFDILGNDVTPDDVDSDPDTDDENDPADEDDHDDAFVCLLAPVLIGPDFVCPGDTTTYTVEDYNSSYTYAFVLEMGGGGVVLETTDSTITIDWDDVPGGPYRITVTVNAPPECEGTDTLDIIIEGGEPVACNAHINLSLDNDCGTELLSGIFLTGDLAGNNTYQVFVIDMNGDTVPNATVTYEHVGQTFKVSVASLCTGQSCWSWLTVEDKLPPIIDCVCPLANEDEECEITCLQLEDFINGDIPEEYRPTVVDNCGGTTLVLTNVEVSFDPCAGGNVLVSWLATDAVGNTSTCEQEFTIIPLTLETLRFPLDYIGECGDSSDPSNTGWPLVNGAPITDIPGYCNLLSTYTDRVIRLCGGGTKIIREWTIIDWCVPITIPFVQTIHLGDHTGPVLACSPNLTINTGVHTCFANVIVPRPQAVDQCSNITGYKLTSTAGIVVLQGNAYVITELPVGTHTATWTVTDECFNSSTCTVQIAVVDNVPPVVTCHRHTVVGLTSHRINGLTTVLAEVFDDGSFDNCSDVTFRARRMTSCLDFDWTTGGACVDEIPGGNPPVNENDYGTIFRDCVPFACCDIGQGLIMIELEVTDAAGNVNYCMVEVEVQDKLAPALTCPAEVVVSCEFLFDVAEGMYSDEDGDGSLNEDPLSALFGNMYDASRFTQDDRQHIVINDPDNPNVPQPFDWGLEGWAVDNCSLELTVETRITDDCSGSNFPGSAVPGTVKLIERIFRGNDGVRTSSCMQRIWVVDYDPFVINDVTCLNDDPTDDVIWPCDVVLNSCPDDIGITGEPIILDDGCSTIGVTHEDTRFDFVDSVCFKIHREWKVLDWCQFDPNTGAGLWTYTQVIKVTNSEGAEFLDAPTEPVAYCLDDPGISLPANNQLFFGENDPDASSCSVHVDLGLHVRDGCGGAVLYDVKIYPFNGLEFIQIVPETLVVLDENNEAEIRFNTQTSGIPSISENGLPYTSAACGEYHRVVWGTEDGCGNRTFADYLFRLEDCKAPTPVCIEGLSTMIMQQSGEVIVQASSFNASSVDDCTPGDELLFSFSGATYQPSFTYTCDNVPEFDVELPVDIWAADAGVDLNCNGQIEWSERNKAFCTTTIVITDENNVCENEGGTLEGEVMTEHTEAVGNVTIRLSKPGHFYPDIITIQDGQFSFNHLAPGPDYTITPVRNDNHRNGVSTLDLVRIQKHLLGQEVFTSPYQYIAADANNSQSVSAIDLIEIRKVILGLQEEFVSNQSWRFVRKGIDMAPGNPWPFNEKIEIGYLGTEGASDMDFVGVKIGDVNNTVQANSDQILPRNGNNVLHVKATGKGTLEVGEEIEIALAFPQVVTGFQWTMETSGLSFVGVNSDDILINEQHTGIHENGIVTMSWNGDLLRGENAQTDMTIRVKFKVTTSGRLMDMLDISDKVTAAEAYTESGEVLGVNLVFNSAGIFAEFALYQNKPNPWNNQTLIGFHLPEDAPATLTVYDMNGQVVKTVSDSFKAGYNSVVLSTDDISAAGVYYYRLESGGYVASKKMVMVR